MGAFEAGAAHVAQPQDGALHAAGTEPAGSDDRVRGAEVADETLAAPLPIQELLVDTVATGGQLADEVGQRAVLR